MFAVTSRSQTLSNLRHNVSRRPGIYWHARQFVVMTTLKVFELKGQSLMLTCSMLMLAALHARTGISSGHASDRLSSVR